MSEREHVEAARSQGLDTRARDEAAAELRHAAASGEYVLPLSDRYPGITEADAYAIQRLNIEHRVRAGARVVGAKIGLTSTAVQKQLGVAHPDYGVLLDEMGFAEGSPIPMSALQQPKIEAEVAFVLGRDLVTERPTIVDVLRAVDFAVPALEIVGSRIRDWKIRFVDTVADNASASAWVIGATPHRLDGLDLGGCAMRMTTGADKALVSSGMGSACLGHPLNAVVWLAQTLARLGSPLKAGDLVLSGALGPMVKVEPGTTYRAEIDGLGSVSASFTAE
jgi:2-keto-4-pentenoate hydratase